MRPHALVLALPSPTRPQPVTCLLSLCRSPFHRTTYLRFPAGGAVDQSVPGGVHAAAINARQALQVCGDLRHHAENR
jgi:hypothetical protein